MREHLPSYLAHMVASMLLLMIPQAEDVLIFVWGIVGGKAHLLNVPLGGGAPHYMLPWEHEIWYGHCDYSLVYL